MCGRFAYFCNGAFGCESLHLPEPPPYESYNIAPTQNILSIRSSPERGQAEYAMLHWGLVPFWSKVVKTPYPLINARAEGIEKKPSFRSPFKHRRCIIPASGFYEWQHHEGGKQPYFIRPIDGGYFSLAGLWEHWQGEGGEVVESCSIITTEANRLMSNIHDRMPVILKVQDVEAWLDPGSGQSSILEMLAPYPNDLMEAYPVSNYVNSHRHDGPVCMARLNP